MNPVSDSPPSVEGLGSAESAREIIQPKRLQEQPIPKKEKPPKKPKKKLTRKQKIRNWVIGIFGFLTLSVIVAMAGQGSTQYGICKVYIEFAEPYPGHVNVLSVDDFVSLGGPVKVAYKRVDPFGVISVNTIDCYFKKDEKGQATPFLQKVDINGKSRVYQAESQPFIDRFNIGVPAILGNMPSLDLPSISLDNIAGYKDYTGIE